MCVCVSSRWATVEGCAVYVRLGLGTERIGKVDTEPTAAAFMSVRILGVMPDSKRLVVGRETEPLITSLPVDEENGELIKLLQNREQLNKSVMAVG